MKKSNTYVLCEGAIMVALAVAINFLKIDLGPEGGSVNFVFIPLMIFALRNGCLWGMGAGLVFGALKCFIGGGIAYGWQSFLLDYAVAYMLTGLAGLFPKHPVLGSIIGAAGTLFSFVLSGVILWGQYMPETFWGLPMTSPWIYSLLYNGSFILCNEVIAAVVIFILSKKTPILKRP